MTLFLPGCERKNLPTDLPDSQWLEAIGKHYSGRITVVRDGQVFAL